MPRRRKHMPAAVHVKAVADSALRCAGLSLCCVCGSSAASTSAVQLEYQQEQEQRKRSMEHRQEISSSTALQCKLQPILCGILPFPPFFSKGNGHFHPSPRKIFACGALQRASPRGRCFPPRIGYPNRHHHPCMVQHDRRCPGSCCRPAGRPREPSGRLI